MRSDATPETETQHRVSRKLTEPKADEPEKGGKKPQPPKAFTNTLGMKFVSVPGTVVQFCIWETRGKAYAVANAEVNEKWKDPAVFKQEGFKQEDTHSVVEVNWEDAQAFF